MNSVQKLASLGCGSAILEAQMERQEIQAVLHNTNQMYKYVKANLKSAAELNDSDFVSYLEQKALQQLNELKRIEFLVDKYRELYKEKFCKIKLQIEKILKHETQKPH